MPCCLLGVYSSMCMCQMVTFPAIKNVFKDKRGPWWIVALCLVGNVFVAGVSIQPLQAEQNAVMANEYNLKLARLYATAKFINWPDGEAKAQSPFVIAVIAPDPFAGGLSKLDGRKLKDRPIETKVVNTVDEFLSCQILFVPSNANAILVEQILRKIDKQPVLVWREQTDSKTPALAACNFVRQGESLIIEINPAEMQRAKLSPDGRLMSLNLVRVVKTSP